MLAWKLKLFNVPGMLLSRFLNADMPPHAKRESGKKFCRAREMELGGALEPPENFAHLLLNIL